MNYFANDKLSKIIKPGFGKFQEDWLLIYDNLDLPALKINRSDDYLSILRGFNFEVHNI